MIEKERKQELRNHLRTGRISLRYGNFDKALESYTEIAKILPQSARAHFFMSAALEQLDRKEDSRAELEKAIALNPKDGEAHFSKGYNLFIDGKPKEALAELEEAIRFSPKKLTNYLLKTIINLRTGDETEAKKEYDRFVEIHRKNNYPDEAVRWLEERFTDLAICARFTDVHVSQLLDINSLSSLSKMLMAAAQDSWIVHGAGKDPN